MRISDWSSDVCSSDLMRKLEADEENYPIALWDKLAEQGFFGIGIPEEWGGLGGDVMMQMIFAREFARKAGGLLWVWGLTYFGGENSIGLYGTDEQKERWQSGRQSCRTRVRPYVQISGHGDALTKKKRKIHK